MPRARAAITWTTCPFSVLTRPATRAEAPNLRNGVLAALLEAHPQVDTIMPTTPTRWADLILTRLARTRKRKRVTFEVTLPHS